MDKGYLRKRITELRLKKGVSEYKMSRDLGHANSYMQKISSGVSLPSWEEFFYICEYFNLEPKDFFDEQAEYKPAVQTLISLCKGLNEDDAGYLIETIRRIQKDTPDCQ